MAVYKYFTPDNEIRMPAAARLFDYTPSEVPMFSSVVVVFFSAKKKSKYKNVITAASALSCRKRLRR